MDQATAARHRLEAMETRAYPLCRTATLRRRPGPGGANRRQPTWPLAAQQQSRAHLCPTKCLLHLARLCSPRGSQATLIYRTAVYGPVCTVVWEGEAARPTPIPIAGEDVLRRCPRFPDAVTSCVRDREATGSVICCLPSSSRCRERLFRRAVRDARGRCRPRLG